MNHDKCISCKVTRLKSKNVRLFRFPKDKERCKKWVLACRKPSLLNVPVELMFRKYKLCSHHFEDHDYATAKRVMLKPSAIPSKFHFFENKFIEKLKEDLKNKLSNSDKDDCNVLCSKNDRLPDSSDIKFITIKTDSNKLEVPDSVLIDAAMNESFYSPEQLKTLTNSFSKFSNPQLKEYNSPENNIHLNGNPQSKDCNIPNNNVQLNDTPKAKIFLKALRKKWIDAEIKAATAKRDYYELKRVMFTKLQNDLDSENSSDFEVSTAIQKIKVHLKKEELATKIEKNILKQQLEKAKIAADNCDKEYCEYKLELSSSDEM